MGIWMTLLKRSGHKTSVIRIEFPIAQLIKFPILFKNDLFGLPL